MDVRRIIKKDNWLFNILRNKRSKVSIDPWSNYDYEVISWHDSDNSFSNYKIHAILPRAEIVYYSKTFFYLSDFGIHKDQMDFYISILEE
jgi:hypothetical protein